MGQSGISVGRDKTDPDTDWRGSITNHVLRKCESDLDMT